MDAKEGDIFAIPVDEKRVGLGQVLLNGKGPGPLYIVVFKSLFEKTAPYFPKPWRIWK